MSYSLTGLGGGSDFKVLVKNAYPRSALFQNSGNRQTVLYILSTLPQPKGLIYTELVIFFINGHFLCFSFSIKLKQCLHGNWKKIYISMHALEHNTHTYLNAECDITGHYFLSSWLRLPLLDCVSLLYTDSQNPAFQEIFTLEGIFLNIYPI